jgi:hypothetical protein
MAGLEAGWGAMGGGLGSSGSRAAVRGRARSEKDLVQSRSDLNLFLKQRQRRNLEKAGKKSSLQQVLGAMPDMLKLAGSMGTNRGLAPKTTTKATGSMFNASLGKPSTLDKLMTG